ncbi:hypothetical protein FJW05_04185 [Mesorhizobium sp. B2-9-1]|uniref:hypothetical protein n=1 Tax=unclassified Mesorhizobium TaxID=325217 RepID=UPI00112957C6|nr:MULTISPECIES: hypothetical protein [unclassified Mesorhizobium]TPI50265.1 hypothetical protein FJW05_04185 [Mesorhizobium sp. B2-9-1]TPJ31441.1 hypothetical protein FJ425_00475 [Mesorhizobium sp. B2-7-2]
MAMIGYVLKRILMVLVGYLVAVLVGLIAVVVIYAILSSLPNAPGYFELMAFTPVAALVVPPLGMFIYFLTIVLTAMQTLVFAMVAEFFSLRSFWLHMLFGAAAAAAGFMLIWPGAADDPERWADMGIIAGGGLVAGLIYWLIAGRDAGLRRPLIKAIPGKV